MTEEPEEYNLGKTKANTNPSRKKRKKCFVIAPIGDEGSVVRRNTEGILDGVVLPALNKVGNELGLEFHTEIAHKISTPGSISTQVINHIVEDDLVVCDLTTLNPNVIYELAIRHAVRKPVITIFEETTDLPFDVKDDRSIPYRNDIQGGLDLHNSLCSAVRSAMNLSESEIDNPIYRALATQMLMKEIRPTDPNREILLLLKQIIENQRTNETVTIIHPKHDLHVLFYDPLTDDLKSEFSTILGSIDPQARLIFAHSAAQILNTYMTPDLARINLPTGWIKAVRKIR